VRTPAAKRDGFAGQTAHLMEEDNGAVGVRSDMVCRGRFPDIGISVQLPPGRAAYTIDGRAIHRAPDKLDGCARCLPRRRQNRFIDVPAKRTIGEGIPLK